MFLTHAQLVDLTGKKYAAAQVRALREMGIDHRVRPDGKPIVLRSTIEPQADRPARRAEGEPDFAALT